MYIANCLFVLSDENPPVIETLRTTSHYVNSIIRIARFKHIKPDEKTNDSWVEQMDVDAPEAEKGLNFNDLRETMLRLYACGNVLHACKFTQLTLERDIKECITVTHCYAHKCFRSR